MADIRACFQRQIADENILMGVGEGLKLTPNTSGNGASNALHALAGISQKMLGNRRMTILPTGKGSELSLLMERPTSIGRAARDIEMGGFLVMKAAWKLDQGDFARKEVSMAKGAWPTLHLAVRYRYSTLRRQRVIQRTPILEWIYRYARQARLVDGASGSSYDGFFARFYMNRRR